MEIDEEEEWELLLEDGYSETNVRDILRVNSDARNENSSNTGASTYLPNSVGRGVDAGVHDYLMSTQQQEDVRPGVSGNVVNSNKTSTVNTISSSNHIPTELSGASQLSLSNPRNPLVTLSLIQNTGVGLASSDNSAEPNVDKVKKTKKIKGKMLSKVRMLRTMAPH